MKMSRYSQLVLLSLLVCGVRSNCASYAVPSIPFVPPPASYPEDPPIRTDKQVYEVKQSRETLKVTIKTVYTNRTSYVVYLPKCKEPAEPVLQKRVRGRWVVAYERPQVQCDKEPVSIKPGETYKDKVEVKAYLSGRGYPRFEVREIAGTYRLVQSFRRRSDLGPLMPLRERVSNEFDFTQ